MTADGTRMIQLFVRARPHIHGTNYYYYYTPIKFLTTCSRSRVPSEMTAEPLALATSVGGPLAKFVQDISPEVWSACFPLCVYSNQLNSTQMY